MKQTTYILLLIILANINLIAQDDLPYNLNGAYISDSKGFRIIKSTMTYDSTDFLAETFNYFDNRGLNFKTIDFYKGEKQGFVNLSYDKFGRLIGFKDFSHWIYTTNSNDNRVWDSTLISWENSYEYDSIGRLIYSSNQWYDDSQRPELRQELKIEYDNNGQISKKTFHNYDLSDSKIKIYFEPNSTKIASNQNIPAISVGLAVYKYIRDTISIENFCQNELKSIQKIIKNGQMGKEFLFDENGKLVRTTTRKFDKSNKLIEEKCVGDCEISVCGGYSDGITYDRTIYEYLSTGLLHKKTFIDSKHNFKMYIEYDFIK